MKSYILYSEISIYNPWKVGFSIFRIYIDTYYIDKYRYWDDRLAMTY